MPPSPRVEVVFGAAGKLTSPTLPIRARLVMKDNHHDVLLLEYQPEAPDAARYNSGVPVLVNLGSLPGPAVTFYGYSDTVRPLYATTGTPVTQLLCTGATYPLRDQGVADWPDGVNVQHVVARIARNAQLSSSCAFTDQPAPAGPQNETWWTYLRRCAEGLGWVVRPNGTDIEFMPRRLNVNTDLVFQYDESRVTTGIGQLLEFIAVQGNTQPGAPKTVTASGVTDDGSVLSLTNRSVLGTIATNVTVPALRGSAVARPANSASEVAAQLAAEQERTRLHISATATVVGDTRLRPGATVLLRGLDSSSNGYWYVAGVEHIYSGNYRCEVSLLRGGTGDPLPTFTPRDQVWFRPGDATPTSAPVPQLTAGTPLSLLDSGSLGRWITSRYLARTVAL